MADDTIDGSSADQLSGTLAGLQQRTSALTVSANGFASAMTRAFSQSAIGGKQFDDVVKSLGLRLSNLAVAQAFKPLASGISGGLNQLFSGLVGGTGTSTSNAAFAMGGVKPFAAGGVIGTPTYFPMSSGGVGLAGEAGPEAIIPLARGPDGRLGVAGGGGRASASINVNISTPDAGSFRRSESYVTGQIARAVARGQRSL